jgi:hypothetical protein
MSASATAESAEYWSSEKATERTLRTLRWRVGVFVALFLAAAIAIIAVTAVKIDDKFSTIERTVKASNAIVGKIRADQKVNSKTNSTFISCSNTIDADFIFDIVRLVSTTPAPKTGYEVPAKCS